MSVTPLSPVTDTATLMPAHPGTVPPTHAPTASESGPTNWEESETYTSEEAVVPMKPSQKPSTSTTSGKPPCKRRRVVSREALNLECLEEEAIFFREGTEFFKESRELVKEVRENYQMTNVLSCDSFQHYCKHSLLPRSFTIVLL